MTTSHFSQQAQTGETITGNQDYKKLLLDVYNGKGKILLGCSDISILGIDNADKQAGVIHRTISLVDAVKKAESNFWGKNLYKNQIENVRAGLRAIMLSAVMQDHPINGRNYNAVLNAVRAYEHLLMDYKGVRFVRKGGDMEKMIQQELILAQVIAEKYKLGCRFSGKVRKSAIQRLMDFSTSSNLVLTSEPQVEPV